MIRKILDRILHNKILMIVFAVALFFIFYIGAFNIVGSKLDEGNGDTNIIDVEGESGKSEIQQQLESKKAIESKKSLLERFSSVKKMFISNDDVENIKIEGETLENFKRNIDLFVKIRAIDEAFNPVNKGTTESDIDFETDFKYFKLKSGKKVEYYKIPVTMESSFESSFRKMIYTSVDFIKNKEGLGKVKLYYKDEEKGVWPWKKDDLLYKILYKREVGKIQPEKEFRKSKDNFTIKMEKSGTDVSIQTMGKDFIKVTNGDNVAYYEVYPDLYNYLKDEVFK